LGLTKNADDVAKIVFGVRFIKSAATEPPAPGLTSKTNVYLF
jgi:hypothetical protein